MRSCSCCSHVSVIIAIRVNLSCHLYEKSQVIHYKADSRYQLTRHIATAAETMAIAIIHANYAGWDRYDLHIVLSIIGAGGHMPAHKLQLW